MDTSVYILEHILSSSLSCKEIERRANLSHGTINNIKRGSIPSLVIGKKIMVVLELPLDAAFSHPIDWIESHTPVVKESRVSEIEAKIIDLKMMMYKNHSMNDSLVQH